MMTKTLLMLPVTVGLLAGCASSDNMQTPQASGDCTNLSGAPLVECQKTIQPASRTGNTVDEGRMMKLINPPPVNGRAGNVGNGGHQAAR